MVVVESILCRWYDMVCMIVPTIHIVMRDADVLR